MFFVRLFVNDFSTTRGPIHAKFCMRAYSGSRCVFSPFGGLRPPGGGKGGNENFVKNLRRMWMASLCQFYWRTCYYYYHYKTFKKRIGKVCDRQTDRRQCAWLDNGCHSARGRWPATEWVAVKLVKVELRYSAAAAAADRRRRQRCNRCRRDGVACITTHSVVYWGS